MEEVVKPCNIIGPLTFGNYSDNILVSSKSLFYPDPQCSCICCDEIYNVPENQQALLTHLYYEHRLVIADVEEIAFLKEYIDYWRPKVKSKCLAHYCSTMLLDKKPDGTYSQGEKYYLLSDVLPEDNQLRRDLQQKRLEKILAQQKAEREDKTYERECLFCRSVITESRYDFLNHLLDKHNLYIAKAENLVFIEELIEHLADKLENLICIFCEKVFKDRVMLKEHMRKKVHKKINPNNKDYDKYFISNYLEMGKNWQSYLKATEARSKSKKSSNSVRSGKSKGNKKESSSDSDNDWSDWEEKDSITIVCLFCKHSETKYSDAIAHMKNQHKFDFEALTKRHTFYDKVKIVNYIRRQIHLKKCISCDEEYQTDADLLAHMEGNQHLKLENMQLWNQPEFFFSTYEDDGLLYSIEDNDSSSEDELVEEIKLVDISGKERSISEEVALSVLSD